MKMPRTKPAPPVELPPPPKHVFAPGYQYENMIGTYEVLSVHGEAMRIRWENGEELTAEVKFQDRILCRFEREARPARKPDSDGDETRCIQEPFRGLAPSDFTLEVVKTSWRSPSGLRAAVTQELDAGGLCLVSSACFARPMIRWADPGRGDRGAAGMRTGFFLRLDETSARYGFFLEASSEPDRSKDWERTLGWLGVPEHEDWLRTLAVENELMLLDPQDECSFAGFLAPFEAGWVWTAPDGTRTPVPRLGAFLAELPRERPAVVECAATLPKDRAVGRSRRLGRDVAQLLERFLPLYRAAVGAPDPVNGDGRGDLKRDAARTRRPGARAKRAVR